MAERKRPRPHRLIMPLGPRVLVKVVKEDDQTDAGLYLPQGTKEEHWEALYGEVIEVARSNSSSEEAGENVSGIPHGARVLFRKKAGITVPWEDQLRLLEVKDVLATVEEISDDEAH